MHLGAQHTLGTSTSTCLLPLRFKHIWDAVPSTHMVSMYATCTGQRAHELLDLEGMLQISNSASLTVKTSVCLEVWEWFVWMQQCWLKPKGIALNEDVTIFDHEYSQCMTRPPGPSATIMHSFLWSCQRGAFSSEPCQCPLEPPFTSGTFFWGAMYNTYCVSSKFITEWVVSDQLKCVHVRHVFHR